MFSTMNIASKRLIINHFTFINKIGFFLSNVSKYTFSKLFYEPSSSDSDPKKNFF